LIQIIEELAAYEAEQYARVVIKATEAIIKTSSNRVKKTSYEMYRIPKKYCQV
jgi:hypothetical protein